MSDQPLVDQVADLDALADSLTSELMEQPGLLRLEPTVKSMIRKFKVSLVASTQPGSRAAASAPSTVTRDGLVLTVADDRVHVSADIATDVEHRALGLAEQLQALIARRIQDSGLAPGEIDITILAIEGQ
ncbi:hypothetical protein [Arthrobacter sp. 260]|uniref:hypothetical protein n=1 Tax=Arthrobacter sp. 260 TaxID=2735314 RepID=UPI001491A26B|nr:hypothetical protein [Arthrobacter sp. 260]NOJ59787.1 hypothetical protein [Arthrobacter sp. 260]